MENQQRSKRNRTITLTNAEASHYLSKCVLYDDKTPDLTSVKDTIICGDLFAVSKSLPESFVDLLIADPPYNISKSYAEQRFKQMDNAEYEAYTDRWITCIKHVLKPNASLYVCCDWKSSMVIGRALERHFTVRNRITWQREKGRGANKNWKNSMEDIWFATVSEKSFTFNVNDVKMRRRVMAPYKANGAPKDWTENKNGKFRDTYPSNFWDDISVPYWSMRENTEHPAQKPEKLFAKLILASSNAGDIVMDPFLGSGTTAVTAKKLGRHFTGVELSREYCAVAQKRLELADFRTEIQGLRDGVFWERNTLGYMQSSEAAAKANKPPAP